MAINDRLRVMLVDGRQRRAAMVEEAMNDLGFDVVARVTPQADLLARIAEVHPDVIIVDMEAPTRDILEDMRSIKREAPKPVVMFTNDGDTDTIRSAVEAGVSAYVVDGLQPARIRPILDAAIARFNSYQTLRVELEDTRRTLAERKTIDRAKGILMKQRGFSEDEAYKALRKAAMERNKKLVEVAQNLIDMAALLG